MKLSPPRTAQARREFVRAVTSLGCKVNEGQRSWMIAVLPSKDSFWTIPDVISHGKSESFLVTIIPLVHRDA